MSEFLKRYVETALGAATLFMLAKLLGVWIGLALSKSSFVLVTFPEIITYITVNSLDTVRQVTTIADGVLVGVTVLSGTFVLVKSMLLNDLTRHPRILVKVIHHNLTGWLEDGHSLYPRLFAWGTFIWLGSIVVIKDYVTAGIPVALPILSVVFAIAYTYQVLSFLDTHISDMISYLYGPTRKTA